MYTHIYACIYTQHFNYLKQDNFNTCLKTLFNTSILEMLVCSFTCNNNYID